MENIEEMGKVAKGPQCFLKVRMVFWDWGVGVGRQGSSAPASWEKTESASDEHVELRVSRMTWEYGSRGSDRSRYSYKWNHRQGQHSLL